VPQDPYEDLYAAQVALLEARKVVEDLGRLGKAPSVTLLCHEHGREVTGGYAWCHLPYIASWITHESRVPVPRWASQCGLFGRSGSS